MMRTFSAPASRSTTKFPICWTSFLFVMKSFGFDKYKVELSVRDESKKEDYAGTEEDWQMAEEALTQSMREHGISNGPGWKAKPYSMGRRSTSS